MTSQLFEKRVGGAQLSGENKMVHMCEAAISGSGLHSVLALYNFVGNCQGVVRRAGRSRRFGDSQIRQIAPGPRRAMKYGSAARLRRAERKVGGAATLDRCR
jgi:hypothetical protein